MPTVVVIWRVFDPLIETFDSQQLRKCMWDCVAQDFYAHVLLNMLSFEFFAFK